MYNCVKCVYICVIVGFVLLVSVGFETSGRCLLKGGKYVTMLTSSVIYSAILKGRFGKIQESISHFIEYNGTFDPWHLGSVPQ